MSWLHTYSPIHSARSNRAFTSALKLAAVAAVVLWGAAPRTALSAEGPFSALHGSWSGGGLIKKSNGTSERIRCRSNYEGGNGPTLQLRLRCASDSYNFDLNANVSYEGGPISGSWSEATRSVNGTIQGRSSNNGRQVQAIAQAIGFTANLTLTTRGDKQSVLILSPGAEVPEVTITLDKR
jgi:hypothetical protein